jgi:peptidyl-tRNA hydrolase
MPPDRCFLFTFWVADTLFSKCKRLNWIEGSVLSIDAGMIDGVPVLLAKPQTYINLSGESVCDTFGRLFNFNIWFQPRYTLMLVMVTGLSFFPLIIGWSTCCLL